MLTRRTLLATPALAFARPAAATIPRDTLVIARQIDDINSLDPHEAF